MNVHMKFACDSLGGIFVYIVLYPRFFIFQVCDEAKLEIIHKKI
jgi:hypothetical protein